MALNLQTPFAVLRTAVLPLESLAGNPTAPSATPDRLGEALAQDREQALAQMSTLMEHPAVREALFLASPDLVNAIPDWPRIPEVPRVQRSLARYFSRMGGRSTPFGLFAGWGLLAPGDVTRIAVSSLEAFERHSRLDMDYCFALCEGLSHLPDIRREVTYRPNTSFFEVAGRFRYSRAQLKDRTREYLLTQTETTPYLARILQRAAKGARLHVLAEALAIEEGVSLEEAEVYLAGVADAQILVPDILPPVTGPEPLAPLIAWLQTFPEGQSAAAILADVGCRLASIDQARLSGQDPQVYQGMADQLGPLPAKPEISKLFQVDIKDPGPPGGSTLGRHLVDRIERGIEVLRSITPVATTGVFDDFKKAFETRYEGREVPLLEALDEESGIGFLASNRPEAAADPLLEGLVFPASDESPKVAWGPRETHLLRRVMECFSSGGMVLNLGKEDLEALKATTPAPLPPGMDSMVKLVGKSEAGPDDPENLIVIGYANGPSCANLLGRFCHGDSQLTQLVKAALRREEQWRPDAIYAEIVHLPEGRIGNVILRPLLRSHEIPFLGRSGAPPEQQMGLEDLLVSVLHDRVVLRSKSLGREVVPCLTNAHNTTRGLGVYRFLCQLEGQGWNGFVWSWGPLEAAPFLPRVQHGRWVFALARWRVQKSELVAALKKGATPVEVWQAVQTWRNLRNLPRWVRLVDHDNKLPVDLDSILSLEVLLDLVKAREHFQLEEMLPAPGESPIRGDRGQFAHELLIPFLAPLPPDHPTFRAGVPPMPRVFTPGTEWAYAQIYAGPGGMDRILTNLVAPLVAEARAAGDIDGWFFIRYRDPDTHLRLRFHGEPHRLHGNLVPRLQKRAHALREDGLLWKLRFDTYQREVERYGVGEAMVHAEKIFEADSDALLKILSLYPGDSGADARWRLTLRSMDHLLEDLGFDLGGKAEFSRGRRERYGREFHSNVHFERALGERFRKERKQLEALFSGTESDGLAQGLAVLDACRTQWQVHTSGVRELAGTKGVPGLGSLAGSYLHMNVMRALRAAHRAQELVLFDFLTRMYNSALARRKRG